jgi:hypothetical protein
MSRRSETGSVWRRAAMSLAGAPIEVCTRGNGGASCSRMIPLWRYSLAAAANYRPDYGPSPFCDSIHIPGHAEGKLNGIAVGQHTAAGILALRADDGRAMPGRFESTAAGTRHIRFRWSIPRLKLTVNGQPAEVVRVDRVCQGCRVLDLAFGQDGRSRQYDTVTPALL